MKFSITKLCKMCRKEEVQEECIKCKFTHAKDMSQLLRYFVQKIGWIAASNISK